MTRMRISLLLGVLLIPGLIGLAQQNTFVVPLRVINNGRPASLPARVLVRNDRRSVTLLVEAGHIVIPADFASGTTLMIEARVGQDLIKVTGIPLSALESSWTIVLADKNFGEDYQNALPKGTNARSACLIVFDPKDGDGTVLGVPKCRNTSGK